MLAVNYSSVRNNFKEYCDRAVYDVEPIIITRKNEENVVMLSLDVYNKMLENLFIRSNDNNYQHILKGIKQLEAGQVVTSSLDENGNEGIGKPEPLINMNGYWSRRITDKDRLIYKVQEDAILIAACKGHYGDK